MRRESNEQLRSLEQLAGRHPLDGHCFDSAIVCHRARVLVLYVVMMPMREVRGPPTTPLLLANVCFRFLQLGFIVREESLCGHKHCHHRRSGLRCEAPGRCPQGRISNQGFVERSLIIDIALNYIAFLHIFPLFEIDATFRSRRHFLHVFLDIFQRFQAALVHNPRTSQYADV